MSERPELRDLVRQIRSELEWAQRIGIVVEPPREVPRLNAQGVVGGPLAFEEPKKPRVAKPKPEGGKADAPAPKAAPPPPPPPPPSRMERGPPSPEALAARDAMRAQLFGEDPRRAPPRDAETPSRGFDGPRGPDRSPDRGPRGYDGPPPHGDDDAPPPHEGYERNEPGRALPRPEVDVFRTPAAQPARPAATPAPTPMRREGALLAHDPVSTRPAVRSLDEIRAELGDCTRCKLSRGRKNIVFGVGPARAELMFIGEGPGANEDLQGEPFVGDAGQLLTKIIEAMGFPRGEVYIANVVKCRPPGNRDPEPDEVDACEPFLRQQIASVQPRILVTLGKWASQTILRTTTPITRLRGQWGRYQDIPVMPTYHPAYLLRNPAEKKPVWSDMRAVVAALGRTIPDRGGAQ
jgi:uracil-DNA glycosylase family 4